MKTTLQNARSYLLAPLLAITALVLFMLDSFNISTTRFMSYTQKESK